jgi:hypothetical protein
MGENIQFIQISILAIWQFWGQMGLFLGETNILIFLKNVHETKRLSSENARQA